MAQLKAAYRVIYRSGLMWQEMLDTLRLRVPDWAGRRVRCRSSSAASAASCKNAARRRARSFACVRDDADDDERRRCRQREKKVG